MNKLHYKFTRDKKYRTGDTHKSVKLCNFTRGAGSDSTEDKTKVTCSNCKKIIKRGFLNLYNYKTKRKENIVL